MIKKPTFSGFASQADKIARAAGQWRRFLPLGMACSVPQILRGENHVDYRYEYYKEDNNRMTIETHSVYFEQKLLDSLTAKGEFVYDSISGATPYGTHDLSGKIITTRVEDTRQAGNLDLDWQLGRHTLSAGFADSRETDYESRGISLSDAIAFNDKNTILQFGADHNFDSVRHSDRVNWSGKDSTDVIIGLSQILSPADILNVAFTFGYDDGYLNDPYRLAEYHPGIFPTGFNIGVPEHRPGYRSKEVLFTSATHYFTSVDASLEASYRFHHDSYDVFSHTLGLTWHQHLGKHFIVEPMFRFYEQSAASFYATAFYGAPGTFSTDPAGLHSSDYRLSEFYSLDFGLQATAIINDHVHLVAGYHRYEMRGLDHTSADMYPQANVFTIGFSILW
ncbi:MAG: DUF3570 domain-containing protein [Verrucomicrobiae bacterium]|nr:DUF3570 domain-containing protein [Verrucomicrobiae bacterium]